MNGDKTFWREIHAGVEQAIRGLQAISKAIVKHQLSRRDADQERKAA